MDFVTLKKMTSSIYRDILLRLVICFGGIMCIVSIQFIVRFTQDISHIIEKDYVIAKGHAVCKSKGGRNIDIEMQSLHLLDGDTGERLKEILVFSTYIEEGEYIEVEYLPHTRYGVIIERGKDE